MKKIILFFFAIFYFNNVYADTCDYSWKINDRNGVTFTFKNATENVARITGFEIFTKDMKLMKQEDWSYILRDEYTGSLIPLYIQPFSTGTLERFNWNLMLDLAQKARISCSSLTKEEYLNEVKQLKAKKKIVTVNDLLEQQKKKKSKQSGSGSLNDLLEQQKKKKSKQSGSRSLLEKLLKRD